MTTDELAAKWFDHDPEIDYSSWDAKSRARRAINEVIEECAEVCDAAITEALKLGEDDPEYQPHAEAHSFWFLKLAKQIRALKG